jgi:hypothetical protein
MKAIASYAFFSVLGAIFGPILVAAVTTVTSEPDTFPGSSVEASRLVQAYCERLPHLRLFTSVVAPENGEECGYKSQVVSRRLRSSYMLVSLSRSSLNTVDILCLIIGEAVIGTLNGLAPSSIR